MHNKTLNKTLPQSQLLEGLQYRDLEGMMKPTIHVDEFSGKMGDDEDIIVLSFFVRDKQAAKDLVAWFEKGYDFQTQPLSSVCGNAQTQCRTTVRGRTDR
jgi:hypothetical protein